MSERRKIAPLFAILFLLIVIDIIGYAIIEGASLMDALYMTVISITTVGYREAFELSPQGKLFTIWVIFSGLGTFFYIAGRIAESALEGNIRRILGRRKMKTMSRLKDHLVIAGFGIMGEQVCRELQKLKIKFIVIDNRGDRFANAEERGYNVLLGDATDEDILNLAGIDKARIFISLLSSDADNIFTVLSAREANPAVFIIARALDSDNRSKLLKIGANRVITPYELSSRRIVNTVLRPNVVEFIDLMTFAPTMSLSIEEFTILPNSPFIGKQIKDSGLRQKFNTIVIAVKRKGEMFFNPAPDFEIRGDDILILVGEKEKLMALD
ncbi:MAG: potassium channel protein [Candidatus Aminicenantes bacterium]|nr:potassium channel protein [Candidatus Aminicenantes bacterium]